MEAHPAAHAHNPVLADITVRVNGEERSLTVDTRTAEKDCLGPCRA